MTELMRLARQHQAKALIADNRLLRALRQADLQWSGELVLKGLSDLDGRRFAAVELLDAMNRMGVTALEGVGKRKCYVILFYVPRRLRYRFNRYRMATS